MRHTRLTRLTALFVLLLALVAGGCAPTFVPPSLADLERANIAQIEAARLRDRGRAEALAARTVSDREDHDEPSHEEFSQIGQLVIDRRWGATFVEAGEDGCHQIPVRYEMISNGEAAVITIKASYLAFICSDGRQYADELTYDRVSAWKKR